MAGYRAGKTRVGCLTGVLLSYLVPGNLGFIGRASAKDIPLTTLKTFYEVCPEEMIVGKPKRQGQTGLVFTLRTKDPNQFSEVYFDYIIDRQTGKSHLAGGDWGWFFVDQVEEIGRADWAKLTGRLSRTRFDPELKKRVAIKPHALGAGNQAGHDWIWEDFFAEEVRKGVVTPGQYIFDPKLEPNVFFKSVHRDLPIVNGKQFARLGVVTRAEENKMSNGGFVADDYFDAERASRTKEWVARFLDGSFDDFSGKIYSDYNLDSVHNIAPFKIPAHWPCYSYIDPGGSAPWAIGKVYVDEAGNKIVVDSADSIYEKTRLNPIEALKWIKENTVVEKTHFVIDYQNIPVMQLFSDEGVHCEPAMKDIKVGVDGAMSEFFVRPDVKLPRWYEATQAKERFERFRDKGAPKVYVFTSCLSWRKEHDNWIWDPVKRNTPKDGANHHCDGFRYLLASNPTSALGLTSDIYANFRNSDPNTALHLDSVSRRLAQLQQRDDLKSMREMDPCDGGVVEESGGVQFIGEYF